MLGRVTVEGPQILDIIVPIEEKNFDVMILKQTRLILNFYLLDI